MKKIFMNVVSAVVIGALRFKTPDNMLKRSAVLVRKYYKVHHKFARFISYFQADILTCLMCDFISSSVCSSVSPTAHSC